MNLTLTYDHRLVDGALAGRFLRDLRERLESWGESTTSSSPGTSRGGWTRRREDRERVERSGRESAGHDRGVIGDRPSRDGRRLLWFEGRTRRRRVEAGLRPWRTAPTWPRRSSPPEGLRARAPRSRPDVRERPTRLERRTGSRMLGQYLVAGRCQIDVMSERPTGSCRRRRAAAGCAHQRGPVLGGRAAASRADAGAAWRSDGSRHRRSCTSERRTACWSAVDAVLPRRRRAIVRPVGAASGALRRLELTAAGRQPASSRSPESALHVLDRADLERFDVAVRPLAVCSGASSLGGILLTRASPAPSHRTGDLLP